MGKATTLRPDFGLILSGVIALTFSTTAMAYSHARSEQHRHAAPSKAKGKGKAKPARHETHRETRHDKATPAGVTTIPSGGLKVYCAGSKSPLMIRKSTQGNGTTVTVICR